MKKRQVQRRGRVKSILLTIAAIFFIFFFVLPLSFSLFFGSSKSGTGRGNVAIIPIEGLITGSGGSYLGTSTLSSKMIVDFIKSADENPQVKVIMLEINSPGGSAVASDEIASAVKRTKKPTVALIREAGASGGYWIASASDHIVANRMSITGSIGVISSYLEFSGLMDDYNVSYQRLVAGDKKDIGTPLRELQNHEEEILQKKLDKIHDFFIEGVAENRDLSLSRVREIATGEFYLGIEALELDLIDQLGDRDTVEKYIKENYGVEEVKYINYQRKVGFLELFGGVFSDFFFNIGEGIASMMLRSNNNYHIMI